MVPLRWIVIVVGVVLAVPPAYTEAPAGASVPVVREIFDRATGNHWLLERQAPGAPGRLVLVGRGSAMVSVPSSPPSSMPVIKAGSRIKLVAHTAVMNAELEATALTTAAAGAELQLRLEIGGRTVRGTALGPGRAEWLPESVSANGVRP